MAMQEAEASMSCPCNDVQKHSERMKLAMICKMVGTGNSSDVLDHDTHCRSCACSSCLRLWLIQTSKD